MENYFAYHNEKKIGDSVLNIDKLEVFTNKSVIGSRNAVAWVISGVGERSPKKYYASMAFIIDKEHTGSNRFEGFENSVSGEGIILKEPIDITNEPWLTVLKKDTANFVRGFTKIHNLSVVRELESIFAPHGFPPK